MKVIPKLNLNKHPDVVDNNSLIDATNLIVSKDNSILQTEPTLKYTSLNEKLSKLIKSDYEIKHIIPCNKELILFIIKNNKSNIISIYRYNEDIDFVYWCTDTDYHNGRIIGTFTYNINNLIIAFSEYFNSYEDNITNKVPLKVINLGNINKNIEDSNDYNQYRNSKLHPICPEVFVPNINTKYQYGSAYKGWYYIFIRYKISSNTYTQWFNTNEAVFVDNFNEDKFFNYYVSSEQTEAIAGTYDADNYISTNKDVSNITFKCIINNIDTKYKEYQLGFICISKSYTKAYKTNDISVLNNTSEINNNTFIFSKENVSEYNAGDIIKSFYNYYNVKSLISNNNRLYIGNYKENNKENDIVKNLNKNILIINFNENVFTESSTYDIKDNTNIIINVSLGRNNIRIKGARWNDKPNGFIYFNATNLFYVKHTPAYDYTPGGGGTTHYKERWDYLYDKLNPTDSIELIYNNKIGGVVNRVIKAEDIIISPFEGKGKIYFYIHKISGENVLIDDISDESYKTNNIFNIIKINNELVPNYTNDTENPITPEKKYNIWYFANKINYTYNIDVEADNQENSIKLLNRLCIEPEQPYNFFIHFIDKYGAISKGFNINYFNTVIGGDCKCTIYINKINNKILIPSINTINNKLICTFKLAKLPEDFIGYFVSYEQMQKRVKYTCFSKKTTINNKLNLYTDSLNFSDKLDLDFNTIEFFNTTETPLTPGNTNTLNRDYNIIDILHKDSINDKLLYVADSYNNISLSTRLKINIVNNDKKPQETFDNKICRLIKEVNDSFYNTENKVLIPCSKINYNITVPIEINTKNAFLSNHHAIVYEQDVFYNTAIKVFQKQKNVDIIEKPLFNHRWVYYNDVPNESLQYNNKPVVVFYPDKGLKQTDENVKTFVVGNIVECKNTIDLYQQKHIPIYELYPKILDNYNENNNYTNDFPKTIRRSNILQDESKTIAWRNFELEQYKNITENKGNIIKLISIGYFFLVHTQHSMFLFNATDTIKSDQNGIQLANTDIWDINYKEVFTSQLGYGGIQDEEHGIVGGFGYVFYDKDSKRIYRYDANKLIQIDIDINNFINKLINYNLNLVDDKNNHRILFNFNNNINNIILSYNYNTNTFISRHTYNFYKGWSTKQNIYLLSKYNEGDTSNFIMNYNDKLFSNATCSILFNDKYSIMKFIEFIVYKVRQVTVMEIDNYLPVEGENTYYAGDALRVYSSLCDTGELDITFADTNKINLVNNVGKPYWHLGNWNFNSLRNKLKSYIDKKIKAEDASRIYGNWFVVKFTFNINKQQTEIESLDIITSNK